MTFLYFAYGSNMLTERLCADKRCVSARALGVAYADGHKLEFSKLSKDGSGKGALVRSEGARAYGVLFEIDDGDLRALDREEGRGYGYERKEDFVVRFADTAELVTAKTYLATRHDPSLRPFDWYLALIVAARGSMSSLNRLSRNCDPAPMTSTRSWTVTVASARSLHWRRRASERRKTFCPPKDNRPYGDLRSDERLSERVSVQRRTPNRRATSALVWPGSASNARASRICVSLITGGLPIFAPRLRAASSPSFVLCESVRRSNSANAESIV